MRIVFYISGHGYGHAVRDIEIVRSLLKLVPDATVHFRTCAPQWLFEPLLSSSVHFHFRDLDFGVRQKNSFSANKLDTLEGYAELLRRKDDIIREELQFLEYVKPDLVLSDITPVAFDAAKAYGRSAIGIGNFSWDWIYRPFLADYPQFAFVVKDIEASYAKSERLLRLPFYGDMSAFPIIEDVPLVARKAQGHVSQFRRDLGFDENKKHILLGLRMQDMMDVNFDPIAEMHEYVFVSVSRDVSLQNCLHIDEARLPFEDVLAACDAVISKPGYSIVSEVIVNHTPMLFVPRNDFVEDPALIKGLQKYAVAEQLSQQNFFAGEWADAFERLFAKPLVWPEIDANGADVIAEKILTI